ncbi:hypothetical protein Ava_2531 [Trichormus variabilis ATCC 29413]|uniref:Uncharacterized protein n=2 Tax=Anabaena variabilis TaxID=264691 RepID=Q3MA40_TRIV2|nr:MULTISPECIES: hypothetical protein [Nostocaceae]ABA22146.1 hypothetical protein Ava_2531 [Trichormus variabilis ATCC 29413]MBC1214902.1 hypothetical protein [Trichormus variabilis ARAD]MBC1254655.1 hypothetical protein [Trichormus variabilis V5]MBC1267450.1 hypothetical protein [Trichormus variabilis FSR]MBC1302443.1 hypothetical protein [Trichormus variabilis N2B]
MNSPTQKQPQTDFQNELVDSIENIYTNFFSDNISLVESVQEEQTLTNNDLEEQADQQTKANSPVRVAPMGCVMTPKGLICD